MLAPVLLARCRHLASISSVTKGFASVSTASAVATPTKTILDERSQLAMDAFLASDSGSKTEGARNVIEFVRNSPNLFGDDNAEKTNIAMSTSFGIQAAVLLHLATTVIPDIPVVWVDTGYLPRETYLYAEEVTQTLGINLQIISNPAWTPARMEALHGKLWEDDTADAHKLYGDMRKVVPMNAGIASLSPSPTVLLSGIRAAQTKARAGMKMVQFQNSRYKILPMLKMTDGDIEDYMDVHDLPRHPLQLKGYHTVGDWHSSRPVKEGEDPRDSRFGGKFQECGLHVDTFTDEDGENARDEHEVTASSRLLSNLAPSDETGRTVVMVKKQMADGSYCKKCNDVAEKLVKDDTLKWVSHTYIADETDGESDGSLLAKEFSVVTAPFFLVKGKEEEEWKVVNSYLQLRKQLRAEAKRLREEMPPSEKLLRDVRAHAETGMAVVMVKKILQDGSFCRKCKDVQGKLEKDGVEKYIGKTFAVDTREGSSDGSALAEQFGVETAPFFLIKNGDDEGGEWKLMRSYLQVKKTLLKAAAEVQVSPQQPTARELEEQVRALRAELERAQQLVEDTTSYFVSCFVDTSDSSRLFQWDVIDGGKDRVTDYFEKILGKPL